MAKITVITHAFNPGEYIYPCVDSVLAQTFQDFEYLILDNASHDGTKEVLEEYAKKDARIRLYRNEDNSENIITSVEQYVTTEYFMVLDHDDYLEPDALEVLYEAAVKEDLDMVFGRCEMVNAKGEHLGEAGVNRNIACIDEKAFVQSFDMLYWQLRTLWGKLIRTELMQYVDMETLEFRAPSYYAWDTVIILSIAFAAKRFGTVDKVLHHYRIFDKSDSRTYHRQRFLADWVVLDMARRLLREREGLTPKNEIYLLRVYYNAIMDTLRLAMRSDQSADEKCEIVKEIVEKEQTSEMYYVLKKFVPEDKKSFVAAFGKVIVSFYIGQSAVEKGKDLVYRWLQLLYGKGTLQESEFKVLCEKQKAVLIYLCVGQGQDAYLQMKSEEFCEMCPELLLSVALEQEKDVKRMSGIIFAVAEKRPNVYQRVTNVVSILIQQNKLLVDKDTPVWEENADIVVAVCAEEYYAAINLCLERLNLEEWQRSGGILELATTLAAILEEAEVFIALKKMSCDYLLQEGKAEEARAVLKDLEEMCPNDTEVQELRNALANA